MWYFEPYVLSGKKYLEVSIFTKIIEPITFVMTISVKSILLLCIVAIISCCSASSSTFAGLSAGKKGSFLFKIPRGGAVTECKTIGELDRIISDAALTDKLVIIDFTATWYGIFCEFFLIRFLFLHVK